jgi:hypothetical protein
MSLGTFGPEGFSFTEAGGSAILKELEEQIDTYIDEQMSELLEHLLEKDEHNNVTFEADQAVFSVYHDAEFYTWKTPLLAMVNDTCGHLGQDPEPLRQTLETLKVAVARIEQALVDRK